jgi:hypothetical protein
VDDNNIIKQLAAKFYISGASSYFLMAKEKKKPVKPAFL